MTRRRQYSFWTKRELWILTVTETRELDGQEVVLHYVTYSNRCLDDFAEAIQQQLAEIGIGVDLELGDSARQWDSYPVR